VEGLPATRRLNMFWPLEESAWSAECYNNEQGEDGCYNNEQGEEGRGGDLQLGGRGARGKHVDVGASDEVACGRGGGGGGGGGL
jgi:hypothetical protein